MALHYGTNLLANNKERTAFTWETGSLPRAKERSGGLPAVEVRSSYSDEDIRSWKMTTEDNRRNMNELKGLEPEEFCCCFCNGGGAMGEAVTLTIQTPAMEEDDESQGMCAHRSCLKKALHPSVPLHPDLW
jgi:hypothetical protein